MEKASSHPTPLAAHLEGSDSLQKREYLNTKGQRLNTKGDRKAILKFLASRIVLEVPLGLPNQNKLLSNQMSIS